MLFLIFSLELLREGRERRRRGKLVAGCKLRVGRMADEVGGLARRSLQTATRAKEHALIHHTGVQKIHCHFAGGLVQPLQGFPDEGAAAISFPGDKPDHSL